jgi:hypothetical protein
MKFKKKNRVSESIPEKIRKKSANTFFFVVFSLSFQYSTEEYYYHENENEKKISCIYFFGREKIRKKISRIL